MSGHLPSLLWRSDLDEAEFSRLHSGVKRGDIVGVIGFPTDTSILRLKTSVDRVLRKSFHELNNKDVEVKRALPKYANPGGGGGHSAYGSVANASTLDSRMDGNRFMQPQTTIF
ncbi:hypothetical protein F0562_030358 [Nyssa sinensis]|uniref:Uncharacterized protein n=1 Tax=Nyssa sinensis TaxID=561372 RepID=A0A5J5AY54_9ASTE|nr:hypothetical protein F0562_030358 [Nyssa sinensis]